MRFFPPSVECAPWWGRVGWGLLLLAGCGDGPKPEPRAEPSPAVAEDEPSSRTDLGATKAEPAVEIPPEPSTYPAIEPPRAEGPYLAEPTLSLAHPEPVPEMPALVEVTLRGRLANPPARPDRELEFQLDCEVADPDDEAAAIGWGALVQLDAGEAKAFEVKRSAGRRAFEFCLVETIHRKRCSIEDMRRNDCDETDAVSLPPLCFVPDGERWTLRAREACTPKWERKWARERAAQGY